MHQQNSKVFCIGSGDLPCKPTPKKLNISLYLLNASELSYPLFNHSTLHPKLTPDSGVLGPRQEGTGD